MADNSIDLVRKTEIEAEEVARTAAKEAQEIVENARNKAATLGRDAEDAARKTAAGKLAGAHAASQQALEKAMEGLVSEMDDLAQSARSRQDEAVKQILAALA